jgi:hypothetical protein
MRQPWGFPQFLSDWGSVPRNAACRDFRVADSEIPRHILPGEFQIGDLEMMN